ncbi:MAG TPA: A/G-specific adenine glycosylase [Streptosporangiaceae bacterium]|nr:A/G-specific adenine glycosylase [Streptosporangiaceae bacterium]
MVTSIEDPNLDGTSPASTRIQAAGLEQPITSWYVRNGRDLPWRHAGIAAWPIMVSEFMLQQTPVARVLPAYRDWMARWPAPDDLANATPGDAVRQWDRLGYPRRALRLHESAAIITAKHDGVVPSTITELRALPGVGSYTAAAIASFAYGQRHAVLDTNVRRVLARLFTGRQYPPASLTVAEQALAQSMLPPEQDRRAATWSVALMELGALICTATSPSCDLCPVAQSCAWLRNGFPAGQAPRKAKPYLGSDRECRGRLLAVLRASSGPLPQSAFDPCWPSPQQLSATLEALIADGLATRLPSGLIALPGDA